MNLLISLQIIVLAHSLSGAASAQTSRLERSGVTLVGNVIAAEEELLRLPLEHWLEAVQKSENTSQIMYVVFHVASESFGGGAREFDASPYGRWVRDYSRHQDRFRKPRVEVLITPVGSRVRRLTAGHIEEKRVSKQSQGKFEQLILESLQMAVIVPSRAAERSAVLFLTVPDLETAVTTLRERISDLPERTTFVIRPDNCFGSNTYYPRANPFVRSIERCPAQSNSLSPGYVCYRDSLRTVCEVGI